MDPVGLLQQDATGDRTDLPAAGRALGRDQHAEVLLPGQHLDRAVLVRRGDQHLGEDRDDLLGQRHGDRAVDRDHAAVGGDRVALVRLAVRLGDVRAGGDAARVGVLDDRDGRPGVVVGGAAGGVGVHVVVVGHLLALQLLGAREATRAVAVEGRGLVRVLAVAEHVLALEGGAEERREGLVGLGVAGLLEPGGHGHVVRGGVREGRTGQALAGQQVEAAGAHRGQHVGVAGRVDHDGHRRVVLGGGADHARAADVDLLDALVGGGARGDGGLERVEVHHDQVEGLDAQLGQLRAVRLQAQVGEDAGVHAGVQGLHPAVEALGEAGELGDLGHRDAGGGDPAGRRTGRDELDPGGVQALCQLLQAGLVVDADQGPTDRADVLGDGGRGAGGGAHAGIRTFRSSMRWPSRASRPTTSTSR